MFWMDGFLQGEGYGRNKGIECARRVLDMMDAEGTLPTDKHERVLYLQCDNKEKTWALLAYAGDLVRAGKFTKVHVNMLIVGHTHEDIDQVFSRFSVFLKTDSGLTTKNGNIDSFMSWIDEDKVWGPRNYGAIAAVGNYWATVFKDVDLPVTSATWNVQPKGASKKHAMASGTDSVRAFCAMLGADGVVEYKYRGFMERLANTPGEDEPMCASLNEDFDTWHSFWMSKATAQQSFVRVYRDPRTNELSKVRGDATWVEVMTHGLEVEPLPIVAYCENKYFCKVQVKDGNTSTDALIETNITQKIAPLLNTENLDWWVRRFEYFKTPDHVRTRFIQWRTPEFRDRSNVPIGGNFINFSPPSTSRVHGREVRCEGAGFPRDIEAQRASLLMPSLAPIARIHTPTTPHHKESCDEVHYLHMLQRNTRHHHLLQGTMLVYQFVDDTTDRLYYALGKVWRHRPPVAKWPPQLLCMRSKDGLLSCSGEYLQRTTYEVRHRYKTRLLSCRTRLLSCRATLVHDRIVVLQDNIAVLQDNIPVLQDNIPVLQDNIPVLQDNIAVPTDSCKIKHASLTVLVHVHARREIQFRLQRGP